MRAANQANDFMRMRGGWRTRPEPSVNVPFSVRSDWRLIQPRASV
jgi:hypothetical protein